jgi:phosphoribosyl-AMP cyclohydrolase
MFWKIELFIKKKRILRVEPVNLSNAKLKYNEKGLIPVVVQDNKTSEVLMMAWMNPQSLKNTLELKTMVYWSRSRNELWLKGKTSGHKQQLVELLVDCDCDCLLAKVDQVGPACHTNNKSCFFTLINSIK